MAGQQGDFGVATPPFPPPGVLAGPNEQTIQPGVESIRIAQAPQVAPGIDEGILDRVVRRGVIAEDQSGNRIEPANRNRGKVREGVMIALLRPDHEVSKHTVT